MTLPDELPKEILDTLNNQQKAQLVLIGGYLEWLSTASSMEACTCEWLVHPDDLTKPKSKRRMIRTAEDHPLCPTHTAAGLIFYFLNKWPHEFPEAIAS